MKKLILLSVLFASSMLFAQVPAKFKYQAILRNSNGIALNSQNVKLRVSVLQGTETGPAVYFEEHTTTTNAFGVIALEVGEGSNMSGSLAEIDWAMGNYYLKVEMSEDGGSSFMLTGISQLASVPYSLHSGTAGSVKWANVQDKPDLFSGDYNDLTNKPTSVKLKTLTQAEMLAITPALGEMVLNTTSGKVNIYNGTSWYELAFGPCIPATSTADAGSNMVIYDDLKATLSANTPVYGSGKWEVVTGTGTFSNPTDPHAIFTAGTTGTYTLKWRITGSCGSTEDNLELNFVVGTTVSDYDQNVYQTVVIGTQTWMKENLKALHYADGTEIIGVAAPENNVNKVAEYGRLYNVTAYMKGSSTPSAQGACPTGWHIPTVAEYNTLLAYLGGGNAARIALMESGSAHWNITPNTGTNSSGFTALPAGSTNPSGYLLTGGYAYFGTSTLTSPSVVTYKWTSHLGTAVAESTDSNPITVSVRCLKN